MRRDRDSIVAAGVRANRRSQESMYQKGPWLYTAKIKCGSRSTRNVEDTFTSIPHLMGTLVGRYAIENETLNIYAIKRVMKDHLRSLREDI
jgi:hypothetical protein